MDRNVDWATAAYKVAKKEKISKSRLKKFKLLLSTAKTNYEETITWLLNIMNVDLPNGIRNKTNLFQAEIERNGDKHSLISPFVSDIVDRPKIRKLCQDNVSPW